MVKRLISVFPRHRVSRRPDKSWGIENWDELIAWLMEKYPKHRIALLGAPSGCYYEGGVPLGCLDLINLPEEMKTTRLSIHLAALKCSDIAIGSISGAMRVAHGASCPSVEWGPAEEVSNITEENRLKTRFIFWPEMQPSVEKIKELVELMMAGKENEIVYPKLRKRKLLAYKGIPLWELPFRILREIVARPFLWRLKKKKLPDGEIKSWWLINQ